MIRSERTKSAQVKGCFAQPATAECDPKPFYTVIAGWLPESSANAQQEKVMRRKFWGNLRHCAGSLRMLPITAN